MSDLQSLDALKGRWVGTGNGWNIIAVPTTPTNATSPVAPGTTKNALLGPDYQLEVQQMNEIMDFNASSQDEAPNKGGAAGQENCFGLEYSLTATEVGSNKLHFENGIWLNIVDPAGTDNPFPIGRLASVPHGNSVLLLGTESNFDGPPVIPVIDPTPISVDTGEPVQSEEYLAPYLEFKQRFEDIFGPNFNPAQTLTEALSGQTVTHTQTFTLSTENEGGITNIPFGKNAEATSWETTVWIETLSTGKVQMQYMQTIMIEFFGIKWPHVVVNTLVRQ